MRMRFSIFREYCRLSSRPCLYLSYARSLPLNADCCRVLRNANFVVLLAYRTLVYVEGDASMRQWEDSEGKKQSTLNIVQRKRLDHLAEGLMSGEDRRLTAVFIGLGNLEVLKRPANSEDSAASDY